VTDPWTDPAFLRGAQYKTDANLAARQSIYAYQHPRVDLAAWVLDLAGPVLPGPVADVGCGNGMYLAELARRGLGPAVGLDLSPGMLAAARQRLAGRAPGAPAAGPVLAVADATALPLPNAAAVLTLSAHMLYHVPDPAAAVRELRRITRPGGRVLIVLNGAGHLRQLRAAAAAARGASPAIFAERVTLDEGAALARSVFATVTRHDFEAELRVPGPEPVADYVRSMAGTRHGAADPEQAALAVVARLPRTPDGHYVISSHAGCLVCAV
jgi:SAM-dependent methyltransferase